MAYAQKSWAEERDSWKAVVLLNLVRSVNIILDVLSETIDNAQLLSSEDSSSQQRLTPLTEHHRNAIRRLGVLRQIERDLKAFLGSGASETDENDQRVNEFSVQSNTGWKAVLAKVRNPSGGKELNAQRKGLQVITSCADDIDWLWKDPATQFVLKSREINLEDSPGL
jgi:hypothetical protein